MHTGATTTEKDRGIEAAVRRILVVEDDRDVARTLSLLLAEPRVRIDVAHDGAEALVKARESRPDLVILDVLLPLMNGYDTMRAFRRDGELRDVPVIYVSSLSAQEAPDDVRGLAWFRKPFSEVDLVAAVRHTLFPDSPANSEETPLPPRLATAREAAEAAKLAGARRFVLLLAPLEVRAAWRERLEQDLGAATANAEDIDSAAALGRSPLLRAIYATDPVFGLDFLTFVKLLREQRVTASILRIPSTPGEAASAAESRASAAPQAPAS